MLLDKHVTVGGSYAKPKEDIEDGDQITILNEGQKVTGDYGDRMVFKVETRNGEKNLSFNQTSVNNLIDSFGKDTTEWKDKIIKVWIIKAMVSNKLRNVIYLTAPDWKMSEEGAFTPGVSTEEGSEEDEISDIPF